MEEEVNEKALKSAEKSQKFLKEVLKLANERDLSDAELYAALATMCKIIEEHKPFYAEARRITESQTNYLDKINFFKDEN